MAKPGVYHALRDIGVNANGLERVTERMDGKTVVPARRQFKLPQHFEQVLVEVLRADVVVARRVLQAWRRSEELRSHAVWNGNQKRTQPVVNRDLSRVPSFCFRAVS